MKLIEMKQKGFKRFFLSGIKYIHFKPEEKIQIILANNGSGKSQLLKEMSPLPSNLKHDYEDDGYKWMKYEHNNNIYIISSGFIHKNKHSFIINTDGNEVELNPGGTKKVQLALVKEHFNLTPALHEILLGINTFTSMSLPERKKWLTEMSSIDYTYPISVYNKLKQRHRDIVGAIKINQTKLTQDSLLIVDDKSRVSLVHSLEGLKLLLEELISSKSNDIVINTKQDTIITDINNLVLHNNKLIKLIKLPDNITKDKVSKEIESLNNRLHTNKTLLNICNEKLSKVSSLEKDIDKESVEKDLKRTEESLDKLLELNYLKVDLPNIASIHSIFNSTYHDILQLLSDITNSQVSLPSNIDTYQAYKQYLTDKIENIDRALTNTNRENDKLIAKIKVLEDNEKKAKIACNKCGHEWHLDFDEIEYRSLISQRDKNITFIKDKETLRDTFNKDLTITSNNLSYKVELTKVIKAYPILTDIFLKIIEPKYIDNNQGVILTNLNKALDNIDMLHKEYPKLNEAFKTLTKHLSEINTTIKIKSEVNDLSKDELETEYSNLVTESMIMKDRLDKLNRYVSYIDMLKSNTLKIKKLSKLRKETYEKEVNIIRNASINEAIQYVKFEISKIEHSLSTAKTLEENVIRSKKNIDELKVKEESLKILVTELSPSEGLIAKSINSFLSVFVKDISNTINSIWSYEMTLLPCSLSDSNDLDYKFPVHVDNKDTIEDVSKVSSSMKEIIDLAFRLAVMKYMGLKDFPLILDEFGKTMDETHRINAYNTIDRIMSYSFEQIYIVSHFQSMYGRFNNANISVLNSTNLSLEDSLVYNEVMEITY